MRRRVLQRYRAAGADDAALAPLDLCLSAALLVRERALPEEHALLLHPARTVLILIDDAAVVDAVVLAAGALLDTERVDWSGAPILELADASARALAGPATQLCRAVPHPATLPVDRLLEELVAAPPDVRLLACAERLDHVRHGHLTGAVDTAAWLHQVDEVYAPLARRTELLLARRFERWADATRKKRTRG